MVRGFYNVLTAAALSLCAAAAAGTAAAGGNPVEPLSNGLALSMTGPEIKAKFGAPTKNTFDARTFGYEDFMVNVGGRRQEIWHLTLKKNVRLSSGIGPGSSRSEVAAVFGAADEAETGQYKLKFSYAGDTVREIRIDPSGMGFKPAGGAGAAAAGAAGAAAKSQAGGLTGDWHGIGGTLGRITLKPDGTYTSPNGAKGRWRQDGEEVVFTGPLASWNQGRGTLKEAGAQIEFYWKDEAGHKYYFAFGKSE